MDSMEKYRIEGIDKDLYMDKKLVPAELYDKDLILGLINRGKALVPEDRHEILIDYATDALAAFGRIDLKLALDLLEAKKNGTLEAEKDALIQQNLSEASKIEYFTKFHTLDELVYAASCVAYNLGDKELSEVLYDVYVSILNNKGTIKK